jgi:leucyl/phenylalanyl-tRNA--protein transferase
MLLRAYAAGIFPMGDSADSTELRWYDPPVRAVIPLDDQFHVPHRLARTLRHKPYRVTLNNAFQQVMHGCAEPKEGRETTWINREILRLYSTLYYRRHAHSIEVWDGKELIGGLYGVSLGRAFFGESMFSRKTDASKIALVHLVALLRHYGYTLLDTQFQTSHLARFGTFEIARSAYHLMLESAVKQRADNFPIEPDWDHLLAGIGGVGLGGPAAAGAGVTGPLQPVTQIS